MSIYDIDLTVHGSNYNERRADVREKAITWQQCLSEQNISYGELSSWQSYFEEQGKRYGLLTEFRENGIC